MPPTSSAIKQALKYPKIGTSNQTFPSFIEHTLKIPHNRIQFAKVPEEGLEAAYAKALETAFPHDDWKRQSLIAEVISCWKTRATALSHNG
jgi:hypothetical protein